MSEQFSTSDGQRNDEDPLAELSRIVSGGNVRDSESEPSENIPAFDLEAELMRELGGPDTLADAAQELAQTARTAPPQKPSSNSVEKPQPEPKPAPQSFDDELMSALQEEVGGNSPKLTVASKQSNMADFKFARTTNFSEAQSQETQPQEKQAAPAVVEAKAPEPARVQPRQVSNGTASPQPATDFAREFEQQIERNVPASSPESTAPTDAVQNFQQTSEALLDAFNEELATKDASATEPNLDVNQKGSLPVDQQLKSVEQTTFESGDGSDDFDLDFSDAFTEELQSASIPPEQSSFDTSDPVDEFRLEDDYSASLDPVMDDRQSSELDVVYEEPEYSDKPAQASATNGRRYAVIALIVAMVTGLSAAGYGFFNGSSAGDGQVPVIKADADPVKVKPEDPGGRQVANQDKVTFDENNVGNAANVSQDKLISDTEEPADLDLGSPELALESKSAERLTADTTESAEQAVSGIAPRKVRTVIVKPDGTILTSDSANNGDQQVALAAALESAQQTVTTTAGEAASQITESTTIAIDGAESSGEISVPEQSPLPKPEPVELALINQTEPIIAESEPIITESVSLPAAKSEWVVQVSSQRSAEAAQASYTNLRSRFGSIFQGRSMAIQRADVEDKGTFYRVRIQTASKVDANDFCTNLKSAGGSCFVTR